MLEVWMPGYLVPSLLLEIAVFDAFLLGPER